ncbi:venom protease-like [Lasioglossum baleicum]|uniref:venom protease-like n=1 Tax=Lasioglossum baleicum TaxID=434251 RepID=UPI003FCC97B0
MMFALSLLPVVLSSLLLSLLVTVSPTQGQNFEGDRCVVNNGPGTCLTVLQCASVYEELLKGNPPAAVCGYVGYQQLVCCPSNTEPTKSTTEKTTTPGKPSGPGPLSGNTGAAVARAKCEEYSRAVYQMVIPQTLTFNQQPVNISVCAIKSRKLIVGGKKADPKEFPHMAAVGYNSANGVVFSCGGSLISERFVLTAAHCFFSVEWGPAAWARVGDLNLVRTDDRAKPQEVRVIERIMHPDYQRPSQYHDVGLLKLESDVTFDAWVRPICLPYSVPDTDNEDVATATGWGKVDWDDDVGSSDMLKVTIKFVDNTRCNQSIRDDRIAPRGIIDDWQICAGQPGKDTCNGDSGGPLLILNKNYNCMYSIVGITSFGGYCGSVIPGVYSRVSNYIPWITKTVWPELL